MNLIRNIVRLTANRYKNARFSTVFLTITLILSMFVISVATSFVAQILQAQDAKKKAMPPHGMAVNFYCEGEEEFKIDALKDMLSVAKSGQGVMIHQVLIHIDKDDVGSYVPVSAQYLGADGQWQYPVTQGRSYTKQEICQGKKVVLIGKSLRHLVEKKNGKSYLSLGKQQYEVLGEVGVKNQSSLRGVQLRKHSKAREKRYSFGYAVSFIFACYQILWTFPKSRYLCSRYLPLVCG